MKSSSIKRDDKLTAIIISLLIVSLFVFVATVKFNLRANVPNFGTTEQGFFTRSGQMTPAGLQYLRKLGVTAVVKLNLNGEAGGLSSATEQKYIKTYYAGINANAPANCKGAEKIADWVNMLIANGEWVHIHCKLGRDRTGLVSGIWRLKYQGANRVDIKNDWKKYGAPFTKYQACVMAVAKRLGK